MICLLYTITNVVTISQNVSKCKENFINELNWLNGVVLLADGLYTQQYMYVYYKLCVVVVAVQ